MNRRFFQLIFTIAVIVTLVAPFALARKARSKGKSPGPIVLTAVDAGGKTITVADSQGKDPATYNLTPLTKITLNGQPAKLSDLTKGMVIDIELSGGGKTADKIDATSPHPDSSKKKPQ